MGLKRLAVVLVMALAGVALAAPPCWACTCVERTKEEQADGAKVVFYGTVRTITGGDTDDGTFGDDFVKVRMRVRTVYKGKNVHRLVTVRTNESGVACGYEGFEVGGRYTVFADRQDGKLFTHICSGTKERNINPDNYGLPNGRPPKD